MSVKTASLSDLTKHREIAAGGEGKIFEHPSDPKKVIKIYHKARNPRFVKHLERLSLLPDKDLFVLPEDIYVDKGGNVLGFAMKYVDFNKYWLFNNIFNKGFCSSNNIDNAFKLKVLTQLASSLGILHSGKVVVGDLNQYNLFVSKRGEILFVDVDSYQTPDQAHSGVLLDDIRDWTTSLIDANTDIYAYDVLCFWATTFCHPYKWVVPGNTEPLEMRVKSHKSILSNIKGVKIPALYVPPTGDLLKQFEEIFNKGRRYMVNLVGTYTPTSVVVSQPVAVSNNLDIREIHIDVSEISVNDYYFALKLGTHWTLYEAGIPKITRAVFDLQCDELYPGYGGQFAYRKGDKLYASKPGWSKDFSNPIFYYNDGSLAIIEYDRDMQWNFNISSQLGGGIDNTNTPVFAKSIIKRSSLLQNFGSQKYLNVPSNNRYMMISIPEGTKDGFYIKDHVALEIKRKKNVEFQIRHEKSSNYVDLDYLPHFAVINPSTILVPEDGFIDVYSFLKPLTRLQCPMCTRDSKLYYTKAGILLLENKILYLLNTK